MIASVKVDVNEFGKKAGLFEDKKGIQIY